MIAKLVERPHAVLAVGASAAVLAFVASLWSGDWSWFPRGGAMLALAGFMVSAREALLYRPARDPRYGNVGMEGFVRTGPLGQPVLYPGGPRMTWNLLGMSGDPDTEDDEEERWRAWDEAEPDGEPVDDGDPGRKMRDVASFGEDELELLRISAVFGTIGTFVWAFGDLLGRI